MFTEYKVHLARLNSLPNMHRQNPRTKQLGKMTRDVLSFISLIALTFFPLTCDPLHSITHTYYDICLLVSPVCVSSKGLKYISGEFVFDLGKFLIQNKHTNKK